MQFLNDILISPIRVMRSYLLGRGILTFGVILANAIGGAIPALVVGLGGALFSGFMRIQNNRIYEDQMADLYRDDIAQQLGIPPNQVTRAHLREAAKDNDVIDQALTRQRSKSFVSFATAALAGLATVALLTMTVGGLTLPAMLGNYFTGLVGEGILGSILKYGSVGMIAGLSSLVLHQGLDLLIGERTGLSRAAAHDRIVDMERSVSRGQAISKEQVYGVLVAGNPELQSTIRHEFGQSYSTMLPNRQSDVLLAIGVDNEMQLIADEINAGRMRPTHLAYMMNEAMPRAGKRPVATASNDNDVPRRNHVASLGRAPRDETIGHVARLDAERAMAALGEHAR